MGDKLTISSFTQPGSGTLTYENGSFSYTPNANFLRDGQL